ncbi:MAG TPA: thioester domain-containing protein [Mycobacterium sp.]|nr:thioester domain-containing protein [Mycobacterium sp.]
MSSLAAPAPVSSSAHSLPAYAAPSWPAPVAVERRIQPAPTVDVSRMTRYRGGTYSHTVDVIVFTDGSTARTDLIRLNPNIDAYSLDFAGIAPTRPSRYSADSWSAVPHLQARAHETEVDWILRNSYPNLSTVVLSARLRAAGYPLGGRNITEHEAIAGTQAAIWYLTNGLELDDRPLDVPISITAQSAGVRVEFDGERQLGGYTARVSSETGAILRLQKSADGSDWSDVAASTVTVPAGGAIVSRTLGVGSTLSEHRHGTRGGGHRHYRLVVDGAATVEDLTFRLDGSGRYRNSEPVVHLYHHLLAGARAAREAAVTPALDATAAVVGGELVGPFRLHTASAATVRAPQGHQVIHAGGADASALVAPGEDFHLRPTPGSTGVTLRIEVPGEQSGFGGRVITGVVCDERDGHCTPLALAVPAQLIVEFDVRWGTR